MAGTLSSKETKTMYAADWVANNPLLDEGEIGTEIDTGVLKVGDGTTRYNSLPQAPTSIFDPVSASQVFGVKSGQSGTLTLTYDGSSNVTGTVETFPSVIITSTYTYTGSNLTQIDATDGVTTWRQTLTYSGSNVTAVSAWVQQ